MATKNKITEMIAAIKTIYPYYAREADVPTLVKTWEVLLLDFPDNEVGVAFYKCLQTCKTPPTPADVIERLEAMHKILEPTDEELWDTFATSLREAERQIYYFRFNAIAPNGLTQGDNARKNVDRLWNGLPEKVKQYIGSKGEFIRMAQKYHEEDLKFEKSRFLKAMPTIQKRQEHSKMLRLAEGSSVAIGLLAEID